MLLAAGTAYPIGSVVISELVSEGSGDFSCFTSTKVQILTPEELGSEGAGDFSSQFTCFTSTKVQILTPEELPQSTLSSSWT